MDNDFNISNKLFLKYTRGASYYYELRGRKLKSGKLSNKIFDYYFIYYSELRTCQLCGAYGGKRKITEQSGLYLWNVDYEISKRNGIDYYNDKESKHILCRKCACKVSKIMYFQKKSLELKKYINKIKKEVTTCKKQDKIMT